VPFSFSHARLDARTSVIAPEGDLDLQTAPSLKWALLDVQDRVVIDLAGVTFMDSTALSVLVAFKRSLGADGALAIACSQRPILRLLEVTGLDQAFDVFPSVEAAITFVREGPARPLDTTVSAGTGRERVVEVEPECDDDLATDAEAAGMPLTGDAAVVLGIASTAMAFARSGEDQAERWLQALRQHGDAGSLLTSLGVGERASEDPEQPGGQPRPRRNAVTTVARHASALARRQSRPAIRTVDLLGAVLEVYGQDFERVLIRNGVPVDRLAEQLSL